MFRIANGVSLFFILNLSLTAAAQNASVGPGDRTTVERYNSTREKALVPGQKVNVFVWNVHKYTDELARQTVAKKSEIADFVLIQESMMGDGFTAFYESAKSMAWYSAKSFETDPGIFTGVTTGSKYRVVAASGILSYAREPVTSTPKMIVLTEIDIKGRSETLLIANIHGINFVSTAEFASQIEQLQNALLEHKGPIIVAGDFNLWWYERALVLGRMARNVGLDYVWLEGDRRTLPLDQMFVRGLSIVKGRVMSEQGGSDHWPLWGEFVLR